MQLFLILVNKATDGEFLNLYFQKRIHENSVLKKN